MTLAEIIARARRTTDDLVEPYAVSDADFTVFANRAEREACERAGLLFEVTAIPILAGTSTYQIDYEILGIAHAALPGRTLGKLIPTDLDWLQTHSPSSSTPSCYAQREQFIELYPTPDAASVLTLKLYRYPAAALESLDDEPEIPPYHHEYLAHWMAFEAWTSDDPDTRDSDKASEQLALFTQRFGRPRSATEIRSWRELPRGTRAKPQGVY